ncbi:ATP-binding protein [Streptomyces sp. NPDC047108]|uniref:ATP-binding protein n=1 Tax=Streptomyces sp. NPDC047108 TaxID=3155025 RepID=UPI0033EEDB1D
MHLSPGPRPEHRPLSDAALTSAVREGRVELFRYLYRRHYAAVQAYSSQCMTGPVQAHEVTSFVFAQLLQRILSGESFADGRHPGCLRRQLLDAVRTTAITHSQREEEALSQDFRAWVAAGSVWPWGEDGQLGLAFQRLAPTTQCLLWHSLVDRDDASLTARVTGLAPGSVQARSEEARSVLQDARTHLYLERMGPRHCADAIRQVASDGGRASGSGRGGAHRPHHSRACRRCHSALTDLARLDAQLDVQLPVRLLGWWPGEGYLRAKAAIPVPLSDPPFLARLLRHTESPAAGGRTARRATARAVSARRGQREPVEPAASRPASHRTPHRTSQGILPRAVAGSVEGAHRSPTTVAVVGFLAGIAVGIAALAACGHQERPHQLLPDGTGDASSVSEPPGTGAAGPGTEASGPDAATPGGYALRSGPYDAGTGPYDAGTGPYARPLGGNAVEPDGHERQLSGGNDAAPHGDMTPLADLPSAPGTAATVPRPARHRPVRRGRGDGSYLPRPDDAPGLSADDSSTERPEGAGWGTRARYPSPYVQSSAPSPLPKRSGIPDVIAMYASTVDNLTFREPGAARDRRDTASLIPAGPGYPVDDRTWTLAHEPQSVGAARRLTRSVLDIWRVGGDDAETVVLVVSELVTNAVEHAHPPVVLHLHRDAGSRLWVGITDGGPAADQGPWTSSCAPDEHGRGMGIVDSVAAAHGFAIHRDGGVTHWARLPRPT